MTLEGIEFLEGEVFVRVDLVAIEDDDPESDEVGVKTLLSFTPGFEPEDLVEIFRSVQAALEHDIAQAKMSERFEDGEFC